MQCICPKCGAGYYGWALNNPSERRCDRCGSKLKICGDREPNRAHNSPFAYAQYKIINNKGNSNYFTFN
jgi:hypothetical protein